METGFIELMETGFIEPMETGFIKPNEPNDFNVNNSSYDYSFDFYYFNVAIFYTLLIFY